jgi:hypothetical protein
MDALELVLTIIIFCVLRFIFELIRSELLVFCFLTLHLHILFVVSLHRRRLPRLKIYEYNQWNLVACLILSRVVLTL